MFSVVICLLVITTSGYGKTVFNIDKELDISDNLINLNNYTSKAISKNGDTSDVTDDNIVKDGNTLAAIKNSTESDKIEEEKLDDSIVKNALINSTKLDTTEIEKPDENIVEEPCILINELAGNFTGSCTIKAKVDNGTALILTPYIEEGRIEEAREACKVDPELFLSVKSYSGFLTVNKTYNSNIFFWYFPVEMKPVNETPWVIWLQGGPGASSLTGLFDEIGPIKIHQGTLRRNQYSWLQNHSLVFFDNPVGTGYSFTDHPDGFAKDMTTYANHLYSALSQFLEVFPELRKAPLFLAGESYGGKYVPALGMEIHKHKDLPGKDINLKGLMIGNAYVEPDMISHLSRPFYYFGLLVQEQLDIVKPLVDSFHEDIAANKSIEAKSKFNSLITILLFLSHQKHAYNFLSDELPLAQYISYLSRSNVKRAIHVGDINFSFVNLTVNEKLAPDFLSNARPLFETLLNHYKVITYCGQLDQMLPCAYTSECYRTWKWDRSQEFLEAKRFPYILNKRLSGYHKTGGGLTEVVVRGAGHMVPLDTPAIAQDLITRWTHDQPLSGRFGILDGSFVLEYVKNHTVVHYL